VHIILQNVITTHYIWVILDSDICSFISAYHPFMFTMRQLLRILKSSW